MDYFKFGSSLWQGRDLPDQLGEEYTGELEGLQFLVALWVLRDIRFVILPPTITDAKRKLTQERRASRLNAFREFVSALQLVSDDPPELDLPSREGLLAYARPDARRAPDPGLAVPGRLNFPHGSHSPVRTSRRTRGGSRKPSALAWGATQAESPNG